MEDNIHHSNEIHHTELSSTWDLVALYRAGYRGSNTIAYRHALMKSGSIESEAKIRTYRIDGYTYWEVWARM